jgi:hypothetical protein
MLECLLARQEEMKANADADREQMMADRIADREHTKQMMARRDDNLREMGEEIRSGRAEIKSAIEEGVKAAIQSIQSERDETIQQQVENVVTRVTHETQSLQKACLETTACHKATETDTEKIEPDPGMIQSIEYQEMPKGETAMMPVRGLKKRRRVRNLSAEHHQKLKERTRGYCGSWKRVTVASRKTTR